MELKIFPYLRPVYETDQLKISVKQSAKIIKKIKANAIAFCGYSGSVFAGALSYALDMPTIAVRKRVDRNFELCPTFGSLANKYVIVDDLIDSGQTMDFIIEQVKQFNPKACPVGIILYAGDEYDDGSHAWGKDAIPIFRI
jgi:adenine/guanine phosphoribosyltransferase-like PRPP-binding protein